MRGFINGQMRSRGGRKEQRLVDSSGVSIIVGEEGTWRKCSLVSGSPISLPGLESGAPGSCFRGYLKAGSSLSLTTCWIQNMGSDTVVFTEGITSAHGTFTSLCTRRIFIGAHRDVAHQRSHTYVPGTR